jgi:hypothetical protein
MSKFIKLDEVKKNASALKDVDMKEVKGGVALMYAVIVILPPYLDDPK